ncbi:MAG: arabinogalactan endo-1,4-beta-galactosidase [Roseburia sp.]|nr:arabinogalactan endo-1,4-beta-galactosidase [Roseburia sp.]
MERKDTIFYKGMDLSFLPQGADEGMQVKDFDGTVMEPLALAKKYGVNSVRLRLWNEPERVPEAKGYCNLAHTIRLAKEIKRQDMSFMLDFHYSDFWADPGNQTKPQAWEELHGEALEEAVYTFTRETLLALKQEGVLPQIVQIGNEIRSGLLFPDGAVPNYQGMTALINAGIRAAREAAADSRMRIMIHLDQGGRYRLLKDWFDAAFAQGLSDFDLIGLSYYPFWHGTFMDLKNTAEQLIRDFGKPIMVVETAHAWRKSERGFIDAEQERIAGIPATPEGQRQVVEMVMNIVASLPNEMGQGVYYWEPLCVPDGHGGWNESMGILAEDGTVMEAVRAFGFMREQACPKKVAKLYHPKEIVCAYADRGGLPAMLPRQIQVLYYDGSARMADVRWDSLPEQMEIGQITPAGRLVGEGLEEYSTVAHISVVEQIERRPNLAANPQWQDGLSGWELSKSGDETVVSLSENVLTVASPMNFRFAISQTLELKESGVYRLRVSFRGVDTTGVDVRMFMETPKQYQDTAIHPTDEDWTIHELENIRCEAGPLTFGIKIAAPPIRVKMSAFCLEKVY